LASDLTFSCQVATIYIESVPAPLETESRDGLTIALDTTMGDQQKRKITKVTIDQHFDGITVLYSPSIEDHQLDILAVPGLGGHAFGSFVHGRDNHMWLADSLPYDMPAARVMTYGYETDIKNSTSFASLEDLASALQVALCRLLTCEGDMPLVLIGHGFGGLLVKEALIRMKESDSESDLADRICACLFFGVPNDGMAISSLIPMVGDQPNRPLLVESLAAMSPQILALQSKRFSGLLDQAQFDIFCFYETSVSPMIVKVSWCLSVLRRGGLLTRNV